MKWAVILLALCVTAGSSGCWRPYYGQQYAQPAYPAAPVFQQPQVIQQAPMVQQQPCAPVVCPQTCTPCY